MTHIEAELPGRGLVRISADPQQWPRKDGEVGFVPHWAIVPDPDQPRSEFDEESLKDIANSLQVNGQREICKVRVLTDEERSQFGEDDGMPWYMLVSGERRWRGSSPEYADIALLEIRIGSYEDAEEQFEDAFLLNESREGLAPLDTAVALQRLLDSRCGGNKRELCRRIGKSASYVDMYLSLNKLTGKVRRYMQPPTPVKQRLRLAIAVELSKLTPHQQDRYVEYIARGEAGRTAGEQRRWLEECLLAAAGKGANSKGGTQKASHLREKITNFPDSTRIRLLQLLAGEPETEIRNACASLSAEEIGDIIERYEKLKPGIETLIKHLYACQQSKQSAGKRVVGILDGWIEVDYYDEETRMMVRGTAISPRRYRELAERGHLSFQRNGSERPEHLPDPDLVEAQ